MQDMFIEAFYTEGEKRGYYLNLKGDKRAKPEKFTRIESLSTLFERGLVWFNEAEKASLDTKTLVEQLLVFEKGSSANDDGPDALEGGIFLHNKQQKQSEKPTFIQRVRKNFW
jgi:predicted phage terminase large subunit-like protein